MASSRRDDANVTLGRQDWSSNPAAQMQGAGTSNNPQMSEVGLSANPAAMQHGLKVDPPKQHPTQQQQTVHVQQQQQQQQVRVAPGALSAPTTATMRHAGQPLLQPATATKQLPTAATTTTVKAVPAAAVVTPVVPQSSTMERSVSTAIQQQRQRMAPVVRQKQIVEQQQQQQAGGDKSDAAAAVGTPIIVQPTGTQKSYVSLALQHLKALVVGSPPDALSLGPPWTKWPDFARTNNINGIIMGLWPSITEAIKQQYVMQMVPQMMADAAKQYGAGVLTGLELLEFDLGPIPPRLDGLKVYDEVGDEQVLLELALAWGSSIKVTVGVTLQLFGYTISRPLTLQNLQLHTRVRAVAQPLLDHMPYIGSAGVSLIEPPFVEFELPVHWLGGVDLMALPMVRGLFRLGLRLASRQFAVYPKGIAVPLVEGGAASASPEGMLEVHLMRISGLRSEDMIGHSDPYVIFRLRQGRMLRSRTVNNNNNPEFDETFKMLVDDVDTQVLQLIVMDEDLVGGGKVMGVAQLPLNQCAALAMPRTKVPLTLTIHKLMSGQRGIGGLLQLPVKVAGVPLNAAAQTGRKAYESMAGALGVGGGKGRTTKVTHLSKVLDETGWLGPSEEFLDEMGKTAWKEDESSFRDQQQQQQQQQGTIRQQDRLKSVQTGGTGSAFAAAPAGPAVLEVQPVSPTGSTSSYQTAFSRSSAGSFAGSSTAGSCSGSPGRMAVAPGTVGGTAGGDTTAAAAVAAATAAAAAARSSEGATVIRRLSEEGTASPFGTTGSTAFGSAAGGGAFGSTGKGICSTGLSRLDSKSAPLPDRLQYSTQGAPPSPSSISSYAVQPPVSPRSDISSSSSTDDGSTGSTSGTVHVHGGKVVKIKKVLHRMSFRSHHEHRLEDADAPPSEVVEHNKQVQAQEDAGRKELRELQQDLTPGETGKGLAGDQLKQIYRGTVFLELTYTPFLKPAGAPTGAGASPASSSTRASASNNMAIMPHDKGILAVTLVRARGLGGWQGEADPYVTLTIMDSAGAVRPGGGGSAGGNNEQTMRSTTVYNEDSPRWNEKFDFIDIRADSILLVTVWDQATIIDAATSLRLSRERFKDQVVGRVKVPVLDVANAGRIKKMWPLQGALMGELELVVQWIPREQLGR